MSERFSDVRRLLNEGIASRAFPCATIEVGRSRGPIWRTAAGRLTYDPAAPDADDSTIFDLASLTKVISTASIAMRLVEDGCLSLAARLSAFVQTWSGGDRDRVTIGDLLEHCAGLAAWAPVYLNHRGRREYESSIASLPLEYAPWTRSLYSDLGFMLLGFVLEDAGGAGLDTLFERLALDGVTFTPDAALRTVIAPTRDDSWRGRRLVGEVDDDNAAGLGGVAGHAGLFGSAPAVGAFARLVLDTHTRETRLGRPETLQRFVTRSTVPGSSRALAWDTMLPTSSCGTRLSPRAFGHTGFTGTSLWIDPERDLYVVLLTNRVHPSSDNDRLTRLRPAIHDAVVSHLESGEFV